MTDLMMYKVNGREAVCEQSPQDVGMGYTAHAGLRALTEMQLQMHERWGRESKKT
jgi:hypothetical protein